MAFKHLTLAALILLVAAVAAAQPKVGEQAPDFTLKDSAGKTYKLSDLEGKSAVVLEFFRSGDW